jgi:hypothetical protein
MVRTQVQLSEDQLQALRQIAAADGVSVSSLVREGVEYVVRARRGVSRAELWQRASELCGAFRSETGDVSVRHDDYFAEDAAK